MDLRISIMPTKNNERIVMRLLNKEAGDKSLDKLGFADQDLKMLNEAIHSPQGMVLCYRTNWKWKNYYTL